MLSPGPWKRGRVYLPGEDESELDCWFSGDEHTGIQLTDYAYQKLHKEPYASNARAVEAVPEMVELLRQVETAIAHIGFIDRDSALHRNIMGLLQRLTAQPDKEG